MSNKAQALLNELKSLAPGDQDEVLGEIVAFSKLRQQQAVGRLRGASKGKALLEKLLADRSRERTLG